MSVRARTPRTHTHTYFAHHVAISSFPNGTLLQLHSDNRDIHRIGIQTARTVPVCTEESSQNKRNKIIKYQFHPDNQESRVKVACSGNKHAQAVVEVPRD